MMNFIKCPNLPQKSVTSLICGSDDERIMSFFAAQGINVLKSEINPDIAQPVSFHADMACLHLGDDIIISDKRQTILMSSLEKMGMTVHKTAESIRGKYPSDIKLNVAVVGDFAIGNFKYADTALSELLKNKTLLNVKQGYSKCSVLVLNESAVITDDESIYKISSDNGIDSLLIRKGDISLDGYDYGFIGGASGKITPDTVIFFGDIEKHRDFDSICLFLKKNGCRYACTDSGKLRDIGGIIALTEE